MAWRPYENLIEGELDNTTLGKITGWIAFYRESRAPLRVSLDLEGDFHEDIRGCKIRLTNPTPQERGEMVERDSSYMDGFAPIQTGAVGDITAGLLVNGEYPYTPYPYVEWYSEANGRVVLELTPEQVAIVEDRRAGVPSLTAKERTRTAAARRQRFMEELTRLCEHAEKTTGKRVTPVVITGVPQK